jgi:hypothetical protein
MRSSKPCSAVCALVGRRAERKSGSVRHYKKEEDTKNTEGSSGSSKRVKMSF